MGGFGSGRTGGYPSIERTDSIVLDVNVIAKIMRKHPGATWRWTYRRDGNEVGWLTVSTTSADDAHGKLAFLRYEIEQFRRSTGEQSQTVRMVSAPCRFGGVRWYFLCPSSGQRCAKLFMPNGVSKFYSRAALHLAYDSTREGSMDRAHRRLARQYRKLGQRYEGPDWQWPFRPKGMRRQTFERIAARIERGTDALNAAFEAGCARFLKRDPALAEILKR